MAEQEAGAESRARSFGPSRSRSRNPSELLARKQQLMSTNGLDSLASWCAQSADEPADSEPVSTHRRSMRRRANNMESARNHNKLARSEQSGATSAEVKLESLSELLLSSRANEPSESAQLAAQSNKSIDNVYMLLAKKEKDLQLAAELGKVLLEKNDELSKANERIAEDYSHRLELLEQDKHRLKRKLDQLNGEYENRLIELQTDCNILRNQLDEQQQVARKKEKEKSKLIDDLVQQNQRLTSELVEATKSEELLSSQLEQMNERFNVRLSNRQDHVAQLDALKEEVQIVNQRKQDLERRLKLANKEKSNLSAALEESGDKVLLLENLLSEKERELGELVDEVSELRDSSSWLTAELESMINLNEKLASKEEGQSGGQLVSQRKISQLVEQLKEFRVKSRTRLRANEYMLASRRTSGARAKSQGRVGGKRGANSGLHARSLLGELESSDGDGRVGQPATGSGSFEENEVEEAELYGGRMEERASGAAQARWSEDVLLEIYNLLRHFHANLQQRKDGFSTQSSYQQTSSHLYSPNSADDSGISADEIDKTAGEQAQAADLTLWKDLLTSLTFLIHEMPCSSCQVMIAERADYEQLQKLHARLRDEVRKKDDELLALNATKMEQEARLVALEEKCAILSSDLNNCDRPREEIVKLAWKARDEAVERKNCAEISLAKTRIENMQITSQLMEVVQQKGELSQKLAQFEDDIHYMTQDSVKAKFTWEEYAEKLRQSKSAQLDSTGNSNPLAQLLGFSVAPGRSTNDSGSASVKSSQIDKSAQAASLMRSFTSNRFNLRFWQKSSVERDQDKSLSGNSKDPVGLAD